ncbi:MAG: hypothetical protein M3Y72_10215 [Acidobacteriota bacterium]|nr:hypothetical protein [Acidobacteriota bacterium]
MQKWANRSSLAVIYLAIALFASAATPHQILEHIRLAAAEQIAKSGNYSCLETIERTYYRGFASRSGACEGADISASTEIMHDRLKLNIAVSGGTEIFAWHSESKFSNQDIDKIVQGGPISSGSFVGFLHNIFVEPGIEFTYRGTSREAGAQVDKFDYKVRKSVSSFRILGAANRSAIVPFHGSLTANAATFELTSLKIVADDIPLDLKICATDSELHYQLTDIAGTQTLIPRTYKMRIADVTNIQTVSRSEYSRCHEFRAQSTLRFDDPGKLAETVSQSVAEQEIPAGVNLKIALLTTIDEKTSFTGDPVDAILLAPAQNAQGETLLSRNTELHGIITEMQTFYVPETYHSLRIQFRSASFEGKKYLLRAIHKASSKETKTITSLFGQLPAPSDILEIEGGTFYIRSGHLHLNQKFKGEWETVALPAANETTRSHRNR